MLTLNSGSPWNPFTFTSSIKVYIWRTALPSQNINKTTNNQYPFHGDPIVSKKSQFVKKHNLAP